MAKIGMTYTELEAHEGLTDVIKELIHDAVDEYEQEVEDDPFQNSLREWLAVNIETRYGEEILALIGETRSFRDGWKYAEEYIYRVIGEQRGKE